MNKLSIIIPCYNEKDTVGACLEKVLSIAEGQNFELEIIIVDDASDPEHREKLKEIAAAYPHVQILRHEKNRGKGASVKTGILRAGGDFIAVQDADMEYDPADYVTMLSTLLRHNADAVFGSRYLPGGKRRVLGFWHTAVNKFLTLCSNMFTNMTLTDVESCYKLIRREVIMRLAQDLKEERFGFEIELTARMAKAKAVIFECPVSYKPRTKAEGKKIGWKDGVRALYCIVRYNLF